MGFSLVPHWLQPFSWHLDSRNAPPPCFLFNIQPQETPRKCSKPETRKKVEGLRFQCPSTPPNLGGRPGLQISDCLSAPQALIPPPFPSLGSQVHWELGTPFPSSLPAPGGVSVVSDSWQSFFYSASEALGLTQTVSCLSAGNTAHTSQGPWLPAAPLGSFWDAFFTCFFPTQPSWCCQPRGA